MALFTHGQRGWFAPPASQRPPPSLAPERRRGPPAGRHDEPGDALGDTLAIAMPAKNRPMTLSTQCAVKKRSGKVDVAMLTTSKVPKTHNELPLLQDELVFLVAATHPLAARGSVSLADLERVPLIDSTATPEPERRWFMRQLFGSKPPRLQRLAFPLTEAVVDAVRARMGVAPMSERVAQQYLADGDLMLLRLPRKQLRRPWRLAYRRDIESAAQQLASVLRGSAPHIAARSSR